MNIYLKHYHYKKLQRILSCLHRKQVLNLGFFFKFLSVRSEILVVHKALLISIALHNGNT